MTTHVLIITDMSGSMYNIADDVRGGFNTYLSELESNSDDFSFTVTLFDTVFIPLCTAVSWEETPRLDENNYKPRGYTALLDAVGKTVLEFESKKTLKEDDKVLVMVQTDGKENASIEFTNGQVSDMIKTREATERWSFVFLGAGPEAWRQADGMGFQRANTVSYDRVATRSTYAGMSKGTGRFSEGAPIEAFVSEVVKSSGGESHGDEDKK